MREIQDQQQGFDLLDRTLETYGADAARWPAGVQTKLLAFVTGNAEARRRIAEARALDTVLGFAPKISDARHSQLIDQIVSRAIHQPRAVASADVLAKPVPGGALKARPNPWRNHALTAGALAASLMLGILAGQNATIVTLAESVLTGGETVESSTQQVAQSDDIEIFWDEDLL
jgi:hypothetical protein